MAAGSSSYFWQRAFGDVGPDSGGASHAGPAAGGDPGSRDFRAFSGRGHRLGDSLNARSADGQDGVLAPAAPSPSPLRLRLCRSARS